MKKNDHQILPKTNLFIEQATNENQRIKKKLTEFNRTVKSGLISNEMSKEIDKEINKAIILVREIESKRRLLQISVN